MLRLSLLAVVVLGLAPAVVAQAPASGLLDRKLLDHIAAVDSKLAGVLGVYVIDLNSGHSLGYHSDTVFAQASSIKIPILIKMFEAADAGKFRWSDSITLIPEEVVAGSGGLQKHLAAGPVRLAIHDLAEAMIRDSDNTATNRCIRMVGMDGVNRMLDRMGFHSTRLRRVMMDSAAAGRGDENVSTPEEMARIMESIYRGKAGTTEGCQEMLAMMKLVKDDMRAAVPETVEVASKPGSVSGVHCETGIVFLPNRPFVVSIMSSFLEETENPVGEITRLVYGQFEKLSRSNEYGNAWR